MYIKNNCEVKAVLLQFKVSNFRCFADEVVFDMLAMPIKEHKNSLINRNGIDILPVGALYGANASGKSSFFMAINRMRNIIVERLISQHFSEYKKSSVLSSPFIFDETTKTMSSAFEISLLIDGYRYKYGFSCDKTAILSESLYKQKFSKNTTAEKLIYSRKNNKVQIGSVNKAMKNEIEYCASMSTDQNLLLTDIGLRKKEEQLCSIFEWFLTCDILLSDSQEMIPSQNTCERFLGEVLFSEKGDSWLDENTLEKYKQFICEIDPNISDIVPSTAVDKNGIEYTIAKSRHTVNGVNFDVPLSLESEGTRKIMFLAVYILNALSSNNSVLLIDELDSKLHPLLLRRIIQMFTSKETNPNGAQLVFSAHNLIILDSSDLRRDEIWFVEKEANKSKLYSLVDFKSEDNNVRSDLNYSKNYLSGRFGAVPYQNEEC